MTPPPSTNSAAQEEGMNLTRDDVERLLHDDSPDSRNNILDKVSVQYNAKSLSDREQEIAEHIFRLLMRDASLRVRETLADRVKENDAVPRDIVLHLANDVESVALPVLAVSKALSDADLVSIVEKSHDMGKLLAISKRETVSERVSSALVQTKYTSVLTSLLGNEGAKVSEHDLSTIATDFASNEKVLDALSKHPKLPIAVVERIISQASDAVAAQLKEKYNLSDEEAKLDTAKIREELMLRLLEGELTQAEIESLVENMAADGSLTPSIMMTALCRGQILFFTVALGHMANIPLANALRLVADRGEHGFAGLYRKSELPESMFDAIRLLVHAVQDLEGGEAIPGSMLYANRLVESIVNEAGDRDIEYLPYFIAMIRQNARRG